VVTAMTRPAPARRRRGVVVAVLVAVAVAVALAVAVLSNVQSGPTKPSAAKDIAGLLEYQVRGDGDHTSDFVSYAQDPPAGGPHHVVWQNCGFYAEPVRNEHAVHSLEHGAVWITYRPGLPGDQVTVVRSLTGGSTTYVLASPYPGLSHPVVLSAWGYQLKLDHVDRERMAQFIAAFAGGTQAPERGSPCHGGTGRPQ